MKILIADAKSLKENNYPISINKPLFYDKSNLLIEKMKLLDYYQIHDLMKISFNQAKIIENYFRLDKEIAALNLYNGVVFKQLQLSKYGNKEFAYLDKHLLIQSPLYGLVRYNDGIRYHRLEMKNDSRLYDYWDKEVNEYLKDEEIISLSTKEYEKMVHCDMIHVDFVVRIGNSFKRNAVYLKKARGMMLDYMILHQIEDIEMIKDIVIDGYHYSKDDSTKYHWLFIKEESMKYIKL